jgi:SagB-type dehydrogenase family enzyme
VSLERAEETVSKSIRLPEPDTTGGRPIWETMRLRRSVRRYGADLMPLQHLSQLLWSTHGITAEIAGRGLRNAPSAGACYPIDVHVVVNRITGVERGLYRYVEGGHELELERLGDVGGEVAAAALGQTMCHTSNVTFVWTAVATRTTGRYGDRGIRYIFMDAGHVGQNMYLAATALGYGCCTIAAFDDGAMNTVLGLDGRAETAVYLATVGPLT